MKDLAKDLFATTNPLARATLYHEFLGHLELTKKSSFWALIFLMNHCSYLAFARIFEMARNKAVKDHLDYFRRDLTDMLFLEKLVNSYVNMWLPLQEVRANVQLLIAKQHMGSSDNKAKCEQLIEANNNKLKIVKDLTKQSEYILDEIGFENGSQLLDALSITSSSPELLINTTKPRDYEELIKSKIDIFNQSKSRGKNPETMDPTLRFIHMIEATIEYIDKIKRSFSKGAPPSRVANDVRILCGLKTESLQTSVEKIMTFSSSIANNECMPKDRREFHGLQKRILNMFTNIIKQKQPTFWFVNDIETNKILYGRSDVVNRYKELDTVLHGNVMKYQFIKSFEKDENLFSCFEKRLTVCKSDCNSCYMNKGVKLARKLYRITTKLFSYEDLKKEAMNTQRLRESLNR